MVFLEESSKGYTLRLTLPGKDAEGRDRGSVILKRFPFKKTEKKDITLANAETYAQHLMDNLLDIIQESSGKELDNHAVITLTAEW